MPGVSALIIAKDEQEDLARCLMSLAETGAVDEAVVLVDDATTDKTEDLARGAGAKVARRKFDDYARQRQAALALCSQEWALWIDADERVDGALGAAIRAAVARGAADAFPIRFSVEFLGKILRFGGLGSEKHVRLFRRAKGRFVGGLLHEGLEISGTTGAPLSGRMIHRPYKDLDEYMSKLERYTDLAAKKRFENGVRFRPWHRLIGPWEFLSRAILRLGFLDGAPGLTWARLSALHSSLKYAKLKRLERRR